MPSVNLTTNQGTVLATYVPLNDPIVSMKLADH